MCKMYKDDMGNYKNVIKIKMACSFVIAMVAVMLDVCFVFTKFSFAPNNAEVSDFQQGLILAIGVLSLINFIKYSATLKSEQKMQLLYNNENDERQRLIRQKAGMPMLMIVSAIMIFSAIVAGYFNSTVFYTLVIAAIIQLTLGVAVKLYFMKKLG